jgi:uncharacterized protein (DUF2267 family)
MAEFVREVANRLPLAEAVLSLFGWICDEQFLADVYEKHRGRSYESELTFATMVQLIADALMEHGGSGRKSFRRAEEAGELPTTIRSVYRKLSNLPIELSMGFFHETTLRLQEIYPTQTAQNDVPKSLQRFAICIHDGKTIKDVKKRLKILRSVEGSVLGGRLVVSLQLGTKLAMAMAASEDGESGETKLLPEALRQAREAFPQKKLNVADRFFFGLPQIEQCTQQGDHFLIRLHKKRTPFYVDPEQEARTGTDRYGRKYTEDFGWVGHPNDPRRRAVRRIHLHRPGVKDELILITDLTNANKYPADDLLELYLQRWTIENVFQQVTEVFCLDSLIGSSAKATVFQASFCFLLYNMIQVIRAYIAEAQQDVAVSEISSELLFVDIQRQLIAWNELLTTVQTVRLLSQRSTAAQIRNRLKQLLRNEWSDRWLKSPSNTHKNPPRKKNKSTAHNSVFRIMQEHKQREKKSKTKPLQT